MGTLLDIRNLSLSYHSRAKETCALDGINLTVNHGEFVSIFRSFRLREVNASFRYRRSGEALRRKHHFFPR